MVYCDESTLVNIFLFGEKFNLTGVFIEVDLQE